MWTCPVCKKENVDAVICRECAFDQSTDCEHYPTLMGRKVKKRKSISSMQTAWNKNASLQGEIEAPQIPMMITPLTVEKPGTSVPLSSKPAADEINDAAAADEEINRGRFSRLFALAQVVALMTSAFFGVSKPEAHFCTTVQSVEASNVQLSSSTQVVVSGTIADNPDETEAVLLKDTYKGADGAEGSATDWTYNFRRGDNLEFLLPSKEENGQETATEER